MVLVLTLILAAIAWLYIRMESISAQRTARRNHSFYQYVVSHHIGTLETIDTGTGLDPTSYVLTLNHRVPDSELKDFCTNLMHLYVSYDHGSLLTIVYADPVTKKQYLLAEAVYNDDRHELQMTLNYQSGNPQQSVAETRNW